MPFWKRKPTTKVVGKQSVGRFYGVLALCPIKKQSPEGVDRSPEARLRETLAGLSLNEDSFFARVPGTYLARLYVLTDVFYEGKGDYEHLKSQYLVLTANVHGNRDSYAKDMWKHAEDEVRSIWQNCVAFDDVDSAGAFARYIKKCQVKNSLLFNGSTDQPVEEQLKGLYLKQEFGEWAAEHQGLSPADLRSEFLAFVDRAKVDDVDGPTWRPGADTLKKVQVP
ncbi:MAG: hypothetical protein ACR2O6_00695 [Ilumatobacteraceae bacterium]